MSTSSGQPIATSNTEFVEELCRCGHVIDERVKNAFLERRGIARIDDNTKWDVIHVGACARWVVPEALMQQLKAPGCMFVPIMQIKSSRLVHVVWKIEKDELGDVRRTVVCDDAPCAWLQHLPDDTEEERNQPGYGLLVKTSTPQDEDG
ncbi:hypothetical protein NLU13_7284 [Sarocladium strictum]|uniref:Uncharacterized protein n=1 Tax=Sarocladium strictum TaxID=5046 RepID=A0AA39GD26_SARSR|nr:hypothetical protein NLU13_7284 [Sarocladium strictum]